MRTRLELFFHALCESQKFHDRYPEDTTIRSIIAQLEFLIGLEQSKRHDRERLADIIIGVLTVREIEANDPQLAELLFEVAEEADRMPRKVS